MIQIIVRNAININASIIIKYLLTLTLIQNLFTSIKLLFKFIKFYYLIV